MGRLVVTTATKVSRVPHWPAALAPFSGSYQIRSIWCSMSPCIQLTTSTNMLLSVAHTRTKMPAHKTMVDAIFFMTLRVEPQRSGIGIIIRYRSVTILVAKDDHTIGKDMAAWQESGFMLKNFGSSANQEELTARVRIDLPIVLERPTAQKDDKHAHHVRACDESTAKPNSSAIS